MALESVETNYVPADDGLINAGKTDSEAEDLEDGEIADDEELEEGAIADDGEDQSKHKPEASKPKPPDKRKSPPRRERSVPHEQDRNSPGGMFDNHHNKKKKKRPEKPRKKNKRPHDHDMPRPHEEMQGKLAQGGPSDRRNSPYFGREPEDGGFNGEDDSMGMPNNKRKRMDNAEHRKRNRRPSPDNNRRDNKQNRHMNEHRKRPCMFYLQGKCHKGDRCQFSHAGSPERKFELCKFYLMDCCAKKDKCLYLHSDFPCKYFHTGMKCFSKENCKFSHEPLTDKTREILLKTRLEHLSSDYYDMAAKHIETAPKEILGEFPRLPRDERGEVVLPIAIPPVVDENGMLPSLLDIKIYTGSGSNNQQEGGMVENEGERGSSSSHQVNERKKTQPFGNTEAVSDEEDFETQLMKRMEAQKHERHTRENDEVTPSFNFYRDMNEPSPDKSKKSPKKSVRDDSDDENGLVIEDEGDEDGSQRGSGAEDVAVPSNLPKRQRELFLRIQNQQLQQEAAAASAESGDDNKSEDEEDGKGENWYSSDDEAEDKNLTEVLKNLSNKAPEDSKSTSKTADSSYDLSNINITDDLTKLLSTIKPKSKEVETNRDPRARDPRSRTEPPKPTTSFAVDTDLRVPPPKPAQMSSGDTDLRRTMFGDTDLRDPQMLGPMGLPFKPAPLHVPCVEIDASISSHPEIPFNVKLLVIKAPDYSSLRLNFMDPSVRSDPRLQKLVADFDSSTASPMSPPSMSSESSRGDPRSRGGAFDPRLASRQPPQPTIIPTRQQQHQQQMSQPPPPVELANFMMMQMAAAAAGAGPDGPSLLGAGPMGGMMSGMMPPGMAPPGNFMPNNMQQMPPQQQQQQQQQQGGYQHHPRGRGRGWRGGRGRGRGGGGGFRGGRGWNNRRDRNDNRNSPADRDRGDRTPEYSNDSDD